MPTYRNRTETGPRLHLSHEVAPTRTLLLSMGRTSGARNCQLYQPAAAVTELRVPVNRSASRVRALRTGLRLVWTAVLSKGNTRATLGPSDSESEGPSRLGRGCACRRPDHTPRSLRASERAPRPGARRPKAAAPPPEARPARACRRPAAPGPGPRRAMVAAPGGPLIDRPLA